MDGATVMNCCLWKGIAISRPRQRHARYLAKPGKNRDSDSDCNSCYSDRANWSNCSNWSNWSNWSRQHIQPALVEQASILPSCSHLATDTHGRQVAHGARKEPGRR